MCRKFDMYDRYQKTHTQCIIYGEGRHVTLVVCYFFMNDACNDIMMIMMKIEYTASTHPLMGLFNANKIVDIK